MAEDITKGTVNFVIPIYKEGKEYDIYPDHYIAETTKPRE